MRRLLIIGNWKMHKTASEAGLFVRKLSELITPTDTVEVVLAPPFTALHAVQTAIPDARPFLLGAQDLFWEDQGPYTGEISPLMLKDVGCTYVIIGHSERRQHFGEQDQAVNRKVRAAIRHGLRPILCLGETLEQHEAGEAEAVLSRQLAGGLEGLGKDEVRLVTIAYEPRWAIGTGRPATVAQAETVHHLLRQRIIGTWGAETAEPIRILYGGSVTPANAGELVRASLIDGALVGGACLDADAFAKIIVEAQELAGT